MSYWTGAEEARVRRQMAGLAYDLRYSIAHGRWLLDHHGMLDRATADALAAALAAMATLREQLETVSGTPRVQIAKRDTDT